MGGHLPRFRIEVFLLLDELPSKAKSPICPKLAGLMGPATHPWIRRIHQSSPARSMLLVGAWLGEAV